MGKKNEKQQSKFQNYLRSKDIHRVEARNHQKNAQTNKTIAVEFSENLKNPNGMLPELFSCMGNPVLEVLRFPSEMLCSFDCELQTNCRGELCSRDFNGEPKILRSEETRRREIGLGFISCFRFECCNPHKLPGRRTDQCRLACFMRGSSSGRALGFLLSIYIGKYGWEVGTFDVMSSCCVAYCSVARANDICQRLPHAHGVTGTSGRSF